MAGKGACEAVFLGKQGVLEFQQVRECMPAKEHAGGIHRAAILVAVAPAADRIKVLQGKAKRIELGMAAGAICTFTVSSKAFTDRQVFLRRLGILQRWHIGWRRFRGCIENHPGNPCTACDRLSLIRAGGHRHDGCIGNHPALPTIGDRLSSELHGHRPADFSRRHVAIPFPQTTRSVSVI